MAEQKKKGFHAFEDRVHQIEEEDAKQREASTERQGKDAGAERSGPGQRDEPGRSKK
jgi:hypothetical protein